MSNQNHNNQSMPKLSAIATKNLKTSGNASTLSPLSRISAKKGGEQKDSRYRTSWIPMSQKKNNTLDVQSPKQEVPLARISPSRQAPLQLSPIGSHHGQQRHNYPPAFSSDGTLASESIPDTDLSPGSSRKRKSPYQTPVLLKDVQKKRHARNTPHLASHRLPSLNTSLPAPSPKNSITNHNYAQDSTLSDEIVPDFDAAYNFLHEHHKLQNHNTELSSRVMSLESSLKALQAERQEMQRALLDKDKQIGKLQDEKQELHSLHNLQSKSLEQSNLKSRLMANYWEKDKTKLGAKVKDLTKSMTSLETMYRRDKLFHEEELNRVKTEFNVTAWKNEMQHRFDQEVKLYKSLADDFETKWRGQQDIIDALCTELKERDEHVANLTNENDMLNKDRRILKTKLRGLVKLKKDQTERINELEVRLSFMQNGPDMEVDASKLKRVQTADDGTQYLVEDDGSIVPIVREDQRKRRQRVVGVNGEFDDEGVWVWYENLDYYDPKLVGKKIQQVTGETCEDGVFKFYLGFDPKKKIGKKIPGCTGFYDAAGVWIWYDQFSPRNQTGPEKRHISAKHEPLKIKAESKIKSIIWNWNYKPRKWKTNSKIPDSKQIARAFV